jgi:hypothetical protein
MSGFHEIDREILPHFGFDLGQELIRTGIDVTASTRVAALRKERRARRWWQRGNELGHLVNGNGAHAESAAQILR